MWVHIVIFTAVFGLVLFSKAGWIHWELLTDKKGVRLFLAVAVGCNLLGMIMTWKGGENVYSNGLRIPRDAAGIYEQEYTISVDGERKGTLNIQIPQKESGQDEQEQGLEKEDPQDLKKQEFQEMMEKYNQEKADSDYYYLPSKWKGHTLEWERPKEHTG